MGQHLVQDITASMEENEAGLATQVTDTLMLRREREEGGVSVELEALITA
jgi:hypothetical protein